MKRLRLSALLVLTVALGLGTTTVMQATPILQAEETFTYDAGSIVGKNGGTGWSDAWFNAYDNSPLEVNDSDQLVFGSGSREIRAAGRKLDTSFSADNFSAAYLLFDVQFGTQTGGGTPNLRLVNDTGSSMSNTGGVGNNDGRTTYGILSDNLAKGADSTVSLDTPVHILFKIDYANTLSSLWVGSSTWDINALPTSGADAIYAFAPNFNRLDLFVQELNHFDNLAIYVTPVPEPAGTLLFGMAILSLVALHRRRS